MSVIVMAKVWKATKDKQLKGSRLLLMLALADMAHDDGHTWPGVMHLANKMRMSKRQTLRLIDECEQLGYLKVDRSDYHNQYWIQLDKLDAMSTDGDKMSLVKDGDKMSLGDTHDTKMVTPMSPKTLRNVKTHEPRARATPPPSPDDATDEMTAVLGQVVKNRITPRSEPQFRETANWLLEQGATHDGVRAFAAWFAEFDDGAPWLANVRNEWTNYVNGRPPSFAGKSRAKRNGNGASKQDQLEQLKLLARRGTTGYTTETKPELAAAGLLPIVERMGRWADICRLPLERFDIEFYRAWNEVHA